MLGAVKGLSRNCRMVGNRLSNLTIPIKFSYKSQLRSTTPIKTIQLSDNIEINGTKTQINKTEYSMTLENPMKLKIGSEEYSINANNITVKNNEDGSKVIELSEISKTSSSDSKNKYSEIINKHKIKKITIKGNNLIFDFEQQDNSNQHKTNKEGNYLVIKNPNSQTPVLKYYNSEPTHSIEYYIGNDKTQIEENLSTYLVQGGVFLGTKFLQEDKNLQRIQTYLESIESNNEVFSLEDFLKNVQVDASELDSCRTKLKQFHTDGMTNSDVKHAFETQKIVKNLIKKFAEKFNFTHTNDKLDFNKFNSSEISKIFPDMIMPALSLLEIKSDELDTSTIEQQKTFLKKSIELLKCLEKLGLLDELKKDIFTLIEEISPMNKKIISKLEALTSTKLISKTLDLLEKISDDLVDCFTSSKKINNDDITEENTKEFIKKLNSLVKNLLKEPLFEEDLIKDMLDNIFSDINPNIFQNKDTQNPFQKHFNNLNENHKLIKGLITNLLKTKYDDDSKNSSIEKFFKNEHLLEIIQSTLEIKKQLYELELTNRINEYNKNSVQPKKLPNNSQNVTTTNDKEKQNITSEGRQNDREFFFKQGFGVQALHNSTNKNIIYVRAGDEAKNKQFIKILEKFLAKNTSINIDQFIENSGSRKTIGDQFEIPKHPPDSILLKEGKTVKINEQRLTGPALFMANGVIIENYPNKTEETLNFKDPNLEVDLVSTSIIDKDGNKEGRLVIDKDGNTTPFENDTSITFYTNIGKGIQQEAFKSNKECYYVQVGSSQEDNKKFLEIISKFFKKSALTFSKEYFESSNFFSSNTFGNTVGMKVIGKNFSISPHPNEGIILKTGETITLPKPKFKKITGPALFRPNGTIITGNANYGNFEISGEDKPGLLVENKEKIILNDGSEIPGPLFINEDGEIELLKTMKGGGISKSNTENYKEEIKENKKKRLKGQIALLKDTLLLNSEPSETNELQQQMLLKEFVFSIFKDTPEIKEFLELIFKNQAGINITNALKYLLNFLDENTETLCSEELTTIKVLQWLRDSEQLMNFSDEITTGIKNALKNSLDIKNIVQGSKFSHFLKKTIHSYLKNIFGFSIPIFESSRLTLSYIQLPNDILRNAFKNIINFNILKLKNKEFIDSFIRKNIDGIKDLLPPKITLPDKTKVKLRNKDNTGLVNELSNLLNKKNRTEDEEKELNLKINQLSDLLINIINGEDFKVSQKGEIIEQYKQWFENEYSDKNYEELWQTVAKSDKKTT